MSHHPSVEPDPSAKPTPSKQRPADPQSVRQGHEPADVGVWPIFLTAAGFVLCFAGVLWATMGVFHAVSRESVAGPPSTEHDEVRPAAPRLEPSPGHQEEDWQHLAALREADHAVFKRRGWADADGNVRVPADVAARVAALSRRPATTRPSTRAQTPYDEAGRQ